MKKAVLLLFLLTLTFFIGCHRHRSNDNLVEVDLPQIQDSGRIVALTLYGSASYFLYRGEPMGFEYELMQQFAKSLGLQLEVKVAKSQSELVRMLQQGEGDIIAFNLGITKELKDSVLFCGDELITHQVLVQRNGTGNHKPLQDVTQLVGKKIHVKPGRYLDRLNNLNKELGGGIDIQSLL